MDESSEQDRGSRPEEDDARDRVGLGRVVEDNRPPSGDTGAAHPAHPADEVEEASEDSFPASDAPPFTSASGG